MGISKETYEKIEGRVYETLQELEERLGYKIYRYTRT